MPATSSERHAPHVWAAADRSDATAASVALRTDDLAHRVAARQCRGVSLFCLPLAGGVGVSARPVFTEAPGSMSRTKKIVNKSSKKF